MMGYGFSKAAWVVVGVVVLAALLLMILSPAHTYTREEALRMACERQLRGWTHRLYWAVRSEDFVFSDGFEWFLESLPSRTETISPASLSCPAAEDAEGRSRYAITDFATSEEIKQKLMEEGTVVLMSDLHGYHEGGRNVLVAVMEGGELQFRVEWRPNE